MFISSLWKIFIKLIIIIGCKDASNSSTNNVAPLFIVAIISGKISNNLSVPNDSKNSAGTTIPFSSIVFITDTGNIKSFLSVIGYAIFSDVNPISFTASFICGLENNFLFEFFISILDSKFGA